MVEDLRKAEANINTVSRQIKSARGHIEISRGDLVRTTEALRKYQNVQTLRPAVHRLHERAVKFSQLTSMTRKGRVPVIK